MFFRSWLFTTGPNPGRMFDSFGQNTFTCAYARWHSNTRLKLAEWHRDALSEIDSDFAFAQASARLIAARDLARARGIGPGSPEYPDLWDIVGIEKLKLP